MAASWNKTMNAPDYFEDRDRAEFERIMSKGGAYSLFLYSGSYYCSEGHFAFSDGSRTLAVNGEFYAPLSFFTHTLGYEMRGGRLFGDDTEADVSDLIITDGGCEYLPFERATRALSISAKCYYYGRLAIVGDDAVLRELDAHPTYTYAGASVTVGEYDASAFTAQDYRLAKDRWRERILGSRDINDIGSSVISQRIDAIDKSVASALSRMNRGDGVKVLFGDKLPTESHEMSSQYEMLLALARGYGTYGSAYYRSESLRADILAGLEWMYVNMYGDSVLEGRGWRDINAFNWWDWYVNSGEKCTDIILIMEEFLTYEQKKNYLKVLEYVLDHWRTGELQDHCSGRMSVGTKTALILEDPKRLARAARDYNIMLEVNYNGSGTHTDFCNYQHGSPYNMMYGLSNLNRLLNVGSILASTPLAFKSPREYNLYYIFKYMYEAAMYKGQGFMSFYGRGNGGSEMGPGVTVITKIIPLIGMFGAEEDYHIRKFIRYSALSCSELTKRVREACSICYAKQLDEILADDSIPSVNDYTLAHSWFTADRAAQHKDDYAFSLAMSSEREPSWECINNANKQGWYTGDGALYLYTDTDRHVFDGNSFINNLNIAYRVPGTTVDTRERVIKSLRAGWRCSRDFTGSQDFRKLYITAAMDLESYNRAEPDDLSPDVGYGGGHVHHDQDLVAKKAWFMLDHECVCLGAGINSTKNADVITVVENRRVIKAEGERTGINAVTLDGEMMPKELFSLQSVRPRYLTLEGVAGYLILDGAECSVARYSSNTGYNPDHYANAVEEERTFVEVILKHGKNPKNATYAYAVVPYATPEKMAEYAAAPGFEIISNTAELQAVRSRDGSFKGMVFWKAGVCEEVEAKMPCIIHAGNEGGMYEIKVNDPTHKLKEGRIILDGERELISAHPRFTVTHEGGKTVLDVDLSISVGEGYSAKFKA